MQFLQLHQTVQRNTIVILPKGDALPWSCAKKPLQPSNSTDSITC